MAPARPQVTSIDAAMHTAMRHHQAGHLAHAEAIYRQVLHLTPNHADALHFLGMIAHQTGMHETAIELMNQAIRANPSFLMHFNLGFVFQAQGKLNEAIACYQDAITLKPDFVEAHLHLGGMFKATGELDSAIRQYREALALKPDFAEAHSNLGNALYSQGRLDTAVECYRKALSIKSNYADAHLNLGNALYAQGEIDAADDCYLRVLSINPNDVEAHNGRASVLLSKGEVARALEFGIRSLLITETNEAKTLIGRCIIDLESVPADPEFRRLVIRAISEPWGRPSQFVAASVALLHLDREIGACIERAATAWPLRLSAEALFGPSGLSAVSDDDLFRCLLESTPASDLGMERFLTLARLAMLDIAAKGSISDAMDENAIAENVLTFYCALARQCFINEYVYSYTADEFDRAHRVRQRLLAALESRDGETGMPVPCLWLVAVAAYFPLHTLPRIESLLDQSWSPSVTALLVQQVAEPLQERRYRADIPRLTAVDDEISRQVRQQYEANPYPRWVKSPTSGQATTVDAFLVREFSLRPPQFRGKTDAVDILIAGCGTGRHPIQTAQTFVAAKVLAVDLSLTSLCYAKRKTDEFGIKNIEYAQADILQLGSIDRTFDIIESHGVLHHLADPMTGWRVLLSLLRPGGFMNLGLYSELARQDVVAARSFIAARGYDSNAEGVRRCRQDLLSVDECLRFKRLASTADFYMTSGCRDLLLHVQEHRFTISRVRDCLLELGLDFIGFSLQRRVAQRYRERFPADKSMTNLDCWADFEVEFPNTFAGMYQFWVRKPA